MRAHVTAVLLALTLVLVACAPPPLTAPAPTLAPTVIPPAPAPTLAPTAAPTATRDLVSTARWESLAVADPGFSIRFPPGWNATQATVDPGASVEGMDLSGPEGRIELRWGEGFGGACARYSPLAVADGHLPACHTVAADGPQRWEQIYRELAASTFAARAQTADASDASADLIRRIFATLAFDRPAPAAGATPLPTAAPGEIIVDNSNFTLAGEWYYFDGGQNYGPDCLLALPGLESVAEARPELPGAGLYEVYGWWCGNPDTDQTRKGAIKVHRAAKDPAPQELIVDYAANPGQWVSLGAFNLQSGAFVESLAALDGSVPADAFRFDTRGPAATEVPATPAATPGPRVSNNPPSPLQQVTAGDLAARLALDDPFYSSVKITPTPTDFDDCATFPRAGCAGTRSGWEVIVAYQEITLTYRVSDDYRLVALAGADAWLDPWVMGQQHPQRVFARGTDDRGAWAVHYRPDNTWRLLRYGTETVAPSESRLAPEQGALLRDLAPKYGTIQVRDDAAGLTYYGLGPAVEPTAEDRPALLALAEAIAALP
jgi:hypothetical protein